MKFVLPIFLCLFFITPQQISAVAALRPEELGSYQPGEYELLKGLYRYVTNPKNVDWSDPNEIYLKEKISNDVKNGVISQESWLASVVNIVRKLISGNLVWIPSNAEEAIKYFNFMSEVEESAHRGAGLTPKALELAGPMAMFYQVYTYPFTNMPASAVDGVKTLAAKLFDAPSATAQGLGFTKLNVYGKGGVQTITSLWTASRNASYMVMIVLLVAAGFMVMFKQQVSPQASVTVQMIVPRLFWAMLAGTFSLAIVGLVIDGVYVAISAIVGMYTLSVGGGGLVQLFSNPTGAIKILQNADSQYIGVVFLGYYLQSAWNVISNTFSNTLILTALQTGSVPVIGGYFQVRGIIYGIEMGLVIWALWANLKIIYTLYMAYIQLIILTILGPLQIMLDIIPSKESQGFEPWIKCVIGNASVFVSTAVIVVVMQAIFNFGTSTTGPDKCVAGPEKCTPIADVMKINGLFSKDNKGFTLPFLGGSDQLAGDITSLGDKFMGGEFILGTAATIKDTGITLTNPGTTGNSGIDTQITNALNSDWLNGATSSKIIGKVMKNTGYTFLLIGFMNLVPTLMTSIKGNLCKGSKDINFDTALKPLQDALNQFTSLKPFKLI
ncbi:MAG: hypothetical protein Q8L51_03640 [Candidatus Amesbacteria bacterium]|nr:hypothetical protein [Candidatus Amesbacteria bacterium]